MNKILCIPLNIYECKSYGNCSNRGISTRYDTVLIPHPQGFHEVDLDNPPENLCKVVERFLFGRYYYHVEPMSRPKGVGWMYGGCIVDSSDSRWGEISEYPLHLHDRQETQQEYDMLSR